jgi:16S rRNA (cytidine1402-2'-O)-methyltransferase
LTKGFKGGRLSGTLFIISTPIGNLADISERAKRSIADADLLLVEDTRVTIKLLNHLGISKKMVSCHKFNEARRRRILQEASQDGKKVALISDAGTPLISDPGQRLVECAISLGMQVVAVPGPTAFVQALVGSGLACERFVFEGFLPEKESAQKARLFELKDDERTLVFYVSPHNIKKTVALMLETLGDRRACVARELTKRFEEYIRVRLSQLPGELTEERLRGEFTMVVEGSPPATPMSNREAWRELATSQLTAGASAKETAQRLSEQFGISKSQAYDFVISIKKENDE